MIITFYSKNTVTGEILNIDKNQNDVYSLNNNIYWITLTCLYDVFNSGDEVDGDNDDRKSSDPSTKTNKLYFIQR